LPIIGNHWRKMIAGQFCRSLGALVVGGASMSTALAIARQTVSIELLRDKYEAAANEVRSGVSFSKAVEKENLFPDSIMGFARLGEESGTLGAMLLKAADRCEQDVKASLTKCTSLVSPIMTALMGLLTAGVIASVMSGVLSLNETVY
ncbi:MAG: type II secretion system F family protein, partial [Pseudomonadota bacterium]